MLSSPAHGSSWQLLRMCKALPKTGTLELGLETAKESEPRPTLESEPETRGRAFASFFINISLSSFAGETTTRSLQECISLPKEGNVPAQNGKSTAHAGAGYPAHNFISSPSH
jgi:hypothetical protein